MAKEPEGEALSIGNREVIITNPGKLYFSQAQISKLDLVRYYLSVAPGALAGIRDRPIVLKRFVNGAEAEAFYQKRAPRNRPPGCVPSRCRSLPAEPPKKSWSMTRPDSPGSSTWAASNCTRTRCARAISTIPMSCASISIRFPASGGMTCAASLSKCKALLEEMGLRGWPKTSGSRGMHVNVRIEPRWTFTRSAPRGGGLVASGRAPRAHAGQLEMVEGRASWRVPRLQPEREGSDHVLRVFSAPAAGRARFDAASLARSARLRSGGLHRLFTVPERFAKIGDPHAEMDAQPGSLEKLLELADKDEAAGLGDAPWPPHFRKMEGEALARHAVARKVAAKKPLQRTARKDAADHGRELA